MDQLSSRPRGRHASAGGRPAEAGGRPARAPAQARSPLLPPTALRDSKNPAGPALLFTPGEWREFTRAVRHGAAGRA